MPLPSFSCLICEKNFGTAQQLENHTRLHTGERPFKCAYCDRRFTQRASQIVHERLHTGSKPYSCLICERTFSQLGNCQSHIKNHHPNVKPSESYKYNN